MIEQSQKVPRILFEIFVYGIEKNKGKVKNTLEELQRQIDKARKNKNKIRVLWYMDNGEKSDNQKKEWFLENGNCKYYKILDGTNEISKTYISDCLKKIRTFESSLMSLKKSDIKIFGKTENKTQIEEATLID